MPCFIPKNTFFTSDNAIFNHNHIYTFFLHFLIKKTNPKIDIQGNNPYNPFLWHLKIRIKKIFLKKIQKFGMPKKTDA